jgi:hypothetical protein
MVDLGLLPRSYGRGVCAGPSINSWQVYCSTTIVFNFGQVSLCWLELKASLHRKSLKSEAHGLLCCLQLFNLQIDNQALERRTQARARMLQEKQEKLAALERSLLAAQEEVRGGA